MPKSILTTEQKIERANEHLEAALNQIQNATAKAVKALKQLAKANKPA